MLDIERLRKRAAKYGADITDDTARKIDSFCEAVRVTNEQFNLTAITDPEEMEEKNALDCLTILPYLPKEGKLADVGTGAGFPGVVIKIARPELDVTLIEATDKKLQFAVRTANELGCPVTGVHLRGEEAGRGEYREQFDVVTSRAVALLPALLEYTLPLVKVGGKLIAMKGAGGKEEIDLAQNALKILGGKVVGVHELTLPTAGERVILEILKEKPCPGKYPRQSKNIRKTSL
ncbi:MAG: 16S rRNA (guanine(527)-N(7))-methyltransferase RsmG [Oscillospiraceae bacterium]|nr:16S rRNA (guanine(527)-N(7))-methyltransferase RsmG [Oscillospiraceae bacterium]